MGTSSGLPPSGLTRVGAGQAAGLQMSLFSAHPQPSREPGKHRELEQ